MSRIDAVTPDDPSCPQLSPESATQLPIPRVGIAGRLFTPLPDITPYELALCMTVLLAAVTRHADTGILDTAWRALPAEAQRHWVPGGH